MDERSRLQRLALRLEYSTIVWNIGEAGLTISLGIAAGSLAGLLIAPQITGYSSVPAGGVICGAM